MQVGKHRLKGFKMKLQWWSMSLQVLKRTDRSEPERPVKNNRELVFYSKG